MTPESAEEKFDRLKSQIQAIVLRSYPNPERKGCPDLGGVEEVARRAGADITDTMEDNPDYQHIMHCSPCYAEFLAARRRLMPPCDPHYGMPRRVEKDLGKSLDRLEAVMQEVAEGGSRD